MVDTDLLVDPRLIQNQSPSTDGQSGSTDGQPGCLDEGDASPPCPAGRVDTLKNVPFARLYNEYFSFVWRCVRAEGVHASSVDDAVQEVFIVVHRRRHEFEERSSPRTWLYAICYKVAANHRRRVKRKGGGEALTPTLPSTAPTPMEAAQRAQALRFVQQFADNLSDAKRPVFVMCLLEKMSAPEAAEALNVNVNTIYSRLRTVREEFRQAVIKMEKRP